MKNKQVLGPATEVPLTHKFLLLVTFLLTLDFLGVAQAPRCILYASNFGGGATTLTALQNAFNDAAVRGCWLFINQNYAYTSGVDTPSILPLTIPRLTLITGVGPQGTGASISFANVPPNTNANAITVANPTGEDYVVIENLAIGGPTRQGFTGTMNGLHLLTTGAGLGPGIIYLRNLVIRNFTVGVYGSNSLSVFADHCNVSANQTDNYQLNNASNSWRIRGGLCSQAGLGGSGYGININSANNTVIEGVRMESNTSGAIRTAGTLTHITHNRFEGNNPGPTPPRTAVLVDSGASFTTLVSNYYASNDLIDNSNPSTTLRFDNGYLFGGFSGDLLDGRFPASLLLGAKRANDATTPTDVFGLYNSTQDAYRTLVTTNNATRNDSPTGYTAANTTYGSWVQELDGRPTATESSSQFRLYYRAANTG